MMNKRFFLVAFLCIGLCSQGDLLTGMNRKQLVRKHRLSCEVQQMLDGMFRCSCRKKEGCSCKFMGFLKGLCLFPLRNLVQTTKGIPSPKRRTVQNAFNWIDVLRLKPNSQRNSFEDQLDLYNAIFTFKKDIKKNVLEDYVFSVRFPSKIWSPIFKKNKVVLGINETINVSRIIGADRVRTCIEKYGLKHVTVPDTYLYHIPGRPDDLVDSNYIVVSKKIVGIRGEDWGKRSLSLPQEVADELFQCTYESGITNPGLENLIATKATNGVIEKVALIDTKCLPVAPKWYRTLWLARAFRHAYCSYPRWIVNPYIVSKKFTNEMVIEAHREQAATLDERYWIATPEEPMQLENPFQEGMQERRRTR